MNTAYQADYRWHGWARVWRTPIVGELSHLLTTRRAFNTELQRASPGVSDEYLRSTYDAITRTSQRAALRLYRTHDPSTWEQEERDMLKLAAPKPVVVLWGDRDPYISPAFAERFGATRVLHLPELGHFVPAEAPGTVAQEVMHFLAT